MGKKTKKQNLESDIQSSKQSDGQETSDPIATTLEPVVAEAEVINETITDPQDIDTSEIVQGTEENIKDQNAEDAQPEIELDTAVATPAAVIHQKKGGTGAMILGGAVAAALGFGAAIYLDSGSTLLPQGKVAQAFRAETRTQLEALEKTVTDLGSQLNMNTDKVGALTSQISNGPDSVAMAQSLDELSAKVAKMDAGLAALDARLSDLTQEALNAAISKEVVDGYQKELVDLQASLKAQREQVETMVQTAQAKEVEVAQISQNTLTRAALTRVDTALQSGRSYAAALAEYEAVIGGPAPDALAQFAQDGLVSLSELSDSFVDSARAALNAARSSEGDAATGSRLGSFLKSQLQARSVTPKEGDDADAVLSRAEAALKDGRLSDSLAELDMLPDASKEKMASWIATATARQDALNTIETLLSATN